jgi:hypothetical protein
MGVFHDQAKKYFIISGFSEENRPKKADYLTLEEYRKMVENMILALEIENEVLVNRNNVLEDQASGDPCW